MAKKKGKGFFGAIGKALGSIPVVGKVKKAAKSVKKTVKAAKKKLKKTAKKVIKKVKKKVGKVYTKARKIKNNLSKSKIVKKVKKTVKKAVLATKKAVKKVKSTVKTVKKVTKVAVKQVKKAAKKTVTQAKKNVKAAVKKTKKALKKVGGKVAVAYTSFKEGGYKDVISAGLDFIPVVGNAKALVEAVIGRDPITGRKLESWERGASVAAILGGPLVKGVKHGGKAVAGIISGGQKATNKTVNLAKSPTSAKPKKQQPPSQANKEASATTAPPAKSKEHINLDTFGLSLIRYKPHDSLTAMSGSRGTAINRAWKLERELINLTGKGTRNWTQAELDIIKSTPISKLTSEMVNAGYTGHHINNVEGNGALGYKWQGDPRNIVFLENGKHPSGNRHLNSNEGHRGSFKNSTRGRLIDRQEMINQHINVNHRRED